LLALALLSFDLGKTAGELIIDALPIDALPAKAISFCRRLPIFLRRRLAPTGGLRLLRLL